MIGPLARTVRRVNFDVMWGDKQQSRKEISPLSRQRWQRRRVGWTEEPVASRDARRREEEEEAAAAIRPQQLVR